jgi:hypothetical protein
MPRMLLLTPSTVCLRGGKRYELLIDGRWQLTIPGARMMARTTPIGRPGTNDQGSGVGMSEA